MAQNRLEKGLPMRKVNINREQLLVKLRENRTQHVENYNKAVEEYKATALLDIQEKKDLVIKALDKLSAKIKDSKKPESLNVEENLFFDTRPPVSHESDYDEIIQLFEMEVNPVVELDSAEFSQYVMDNWSWKGELENSRTFYATKQVGFAAHK